MVFKIINLFDYLYLPILVAELNQLHVTKPSKKSIDEKVKRNIAITFQKLQPTCLRFS